MILVGLAVALVVGVSLALRAKSRAHTGAQVTSPAANATAAMTAPALAAATENSGVSAQHTGSVARTPWFAAIILQGLDATAALRINGQAYAILRNDAIDEDDAAFFRGFINVPPGEHEFTIQQQQQTLTFTLAVEAGTLYVRSYDVATNTVRGRESSSTAPRALELIAQLTAADALQPWPVRTLYILDATADVSINGQALKAAPFIAVTNLGGQPCMVRHAGVALSIPRATEGSTVLAIEDGPMIRNLPRLRGNVAVEYSERAHGWPALYRTDADGRILLISAPVPDADVPRTWPRATSVPPA